MYNHALIVRNKWLSGAALDVFKEEPLPLTSELWGLDNVRQTYIVSNACTIIPIGCHYSTHGSSDHDR